MMCVLCVLAAVTEAGVLVLGDADVCVAGW